MASAQPASAVRAFVRAGTLDIEYLRRGRGRPVVVLADEPIQSELLAALSWQFLTIAPHPPAAQTGGWLGDFIDALGLIRPSCVVDARGSAAAAELASREGQWLDRVVLLNRTDDARKRDRTDRVRANATRWLSITRAAHSASLNAIERVAIAKFLDE